MVQAARTILTPKSKSFIYQINVSPTTINDLHVQDYMYSEMVGLTCKEPDTTRRLSESMLILDNFYLHNDMYLSPHTMESVKDGEPSIQGVLRATVCQ